MANNIISARLEEGANNESLLLKACPCDDQMEHYIAEAHDYAAKLDRLVEAASAVIIQRQEGPVIGWNYDAIGVAALNELTAALREIELPKTDTHGT